MARIRSIKPEFWSSPSMAGLSPWARLLFIAMWNWADDTGRGTANPKELAAFAFPHDDDMDASELPSLLAEIRGRFGVVFYEVAGRRYYAIPSWDRHQRNERRAGSRHPAPEDGVEYDPGPQGPPDQPKSEGPLTPTEAPPEIVGTSDAPYGSSGPGTGEQGNRGIPPTAAVNDGAPEVTDSTPGEQGSLITVAAPKKPQQAEVVDLPEPLTQTQRSKRITDAYHAIQPMCRWPAVNGIVLTAIKAKKYTDDEIRDGLLRMAESGRTVTVETLRVELEGFAPGRQQSTGQSPKGSTTDDRVRAVLDLKNRVLARQQAVEGA